MKIASLRFFLQAGVTEANKLIEVLFRKALGVAVATSPTDTAPVFLEADCLQPVGLASDEGAAALYSSLVRGLPFADGVLCLPSKIPLR